LVCVVSVRLHSVIAFNPGVVPRLISMSPDEDYIAGEISDMNKLEICRAVNGRIDGKQVHVLSYLGQRWGAGTPRFSMEQAISWSRKVHDAGGVITWDVPIQVSGLLSEPFIDQLTAVSKVLSGK
jgi:hypothetical protein